MGGSGQLNGDHTGAGTGCTDVFEPQSDRITDLGNRRQAPDQKKQQQDFCSDANHKHRK
jgi:hypothetical protein